MAQDDNKKIEALLAKASRAQGVANQGLGKAAAVAAKDEDKIGDAIRTAASTAKNVEEIADGVRGVKKTLVLVKEAALGLWNIVQPVVSNPLTRWIGNKYMKAWNKFCYTTDKETGVRTISRKRAGMMLAATFCAVAGVVPGIPGGGLVRGVVGEVVSPVWDGVRMTSTSTLSAIEGKGFQLHHETVYLSDSKETDPEHDLHSVKGCRTLTNCSEEEAVYYRVKPSAAHNIWKGGFFIPDLVVGSISPGVNKCEVTSYGFRWRVDRLFQAWPVMLEAKCTPLTTKFDGAAAPQATPATIAAQAVAPRANTPAP